MWREEGVCGVGVGDVIEVGDRVEDGVMEERE